MSFLLSDAEFDEAALALQQGEVTAPLYAFLGRIVSAQARTGLTQPEGRGSSSREALEETLHDWLADRLLAGGLRQAFDFASSPRTLARYLERSLRNWLVDRSRRIGRPRLLARARQLLEDGAEFERVADAPDWIDDTWRLAGSHVEGAMANEAELVRLMYSVPELRLIRAPSASARAAPVISNADLLRLLRAVFTGASAPLSLRQIEAALRQRFHFAYSEREISIEERLAEPTNESSALDELSARVTVQQILASLSERQLRMLLGRAERRTLDQLASEHGCSRGTADNELRRASAIVAHHVLDEEQYERIMEILLGVTSM